MNVSSRQPETPEAALRDRDVVCVGFNDWAAEVWTNQHHLMARLAAANRVLFVESLGLRRPTLTGRDLRRIARRLVTGLRGARRVSLGDGGGALSVLSPLVLPAQTSRLGQRVNRWLLPRLVVRALRRLGMHAPILWAYVPQAESLIDRLRPRVVIYHCVDDIAAHPQIDSRSFDESERRFVARADLVLASSSVLAERLRALGAEVHYLPNVADTELFATALQPGRIDPALTDLPEPRIVFAGAVSGMKLDLDLLAELARLRPSWSIVIVGPVGLGDPGIDVSDLRSLANVHLLGSRPHSALPSVFRGAQAAIIPYAQNRLTQSIFPMKAYEYLSAGLPVVSTPLPSLREMGEIAFASTAPEFATALDHALVDDDPDRRRQRSQQAANHSWEARLRELAELISAAEGR